MNTNGNSGYELYHEPCDIVVPSNYGATTGTQRSEELNDYRQKIKPSYRDRFNGDFNKDLIITFITANGFLRFFQAKNVVGKKFTSHQEMMTEYNKIGLYGKICNQLNQGELPYCGYIDIGDGWVEQGKIFKAFTGDTIIGNKTEQPILISIDSGGDNKDIYMNSPFSDQSFPLIQPQI